MVKPVMTFNLTTCNGSNGSVVNGTIDSAHNGTMGNDGNNDLEEDEMDTVSHTHL